MTTSIRFENSPIIARIRALKWKQKEWEFVAISQKKRRFLHDLTKPSYKYVEKPYLQAPLAALCRIWQDAEELPKELSLQKNAFLIK